MRDGYIRSSSSGRAGPGVYLTTMDPKKHDKMSIARSNYQGGASKNLRQGLENHCFRFDHIRQSKLEFVRENTHRYKGVKLPLEKSVEVSPILSWLSFVPVLGEAIHFIYGLVESMDRRNQKKRLQAAIQNVLYETVKRWWISFYAIEHDKDWEDYKVKCKKCNVVVAMHYHTIESVDSDTLQRALQDHENTHLVQDFSSRCWFSSYYLTRFGTSTSSRFMNNIESHRYYIQCTKCRKEVSRKSSQDESMDPAVVLRILKSHAAEHSDPYILFFGVVFSFFIFYLVSLYAQRVKTASHEINP